MIKRERDPKLRPASLDPAGQNYIDELRKNQDKVKGNLGKPWAKVSKSLVFKLYARDVDVKKALSNIFGNKCAYCECTLDGQDLHTEHFRPKALVDAIDNPTEEGYWWLAADWDNLLPACNHCNRSPGVDHVTSTPGDSGKGNRFPLMDETKRAKIPGQEIDEKPKLLNPTVDEPSSFISFVEVAGLSLVNKVSTDRNSEEWIRADATISILGLNRPPLIRRRTEHLKPLKALLRSFIRAAVRYNSSIKGNEPAQVQASAKAEMNEVWNEIHEIYLSEQRKEYLHAVVKCIDEEFRAVGLSLKSLSGGQSLYLPEACLN